MTNKIDYPQGHPLHGQTVEWVRERAEITSLISEDTGPDGKVHLYPSSFAALTHEYRRLSLQVSSCEGLKKELEESCDTANKVGRAMGMCVGDDASGALEFAKKLREQIKELEEQKWEWEHPRPVKSSNLAGDQIFEVLKKADARIAELEKHIDTATDCISRTSVAIQQSQRLESQLDDIETLYTDNYGNAMLIHLGLVGIFGVPESE